MYHDSNLVERVIAAIEVGEGSEHYRHGRETMRDDAVKAVADMAAESEAYMRQHSPSLNGPVVAQIAFLDGRAYLAPAGSTLGDPQVWLLVESLKHAAERVGAELRG